MSDWRERLQAPREEKRATAGWRLARASWRLLRGERTVLWLGLGMAACAVALTLGWFLLASGQGRGARGGDLAFDRFLEISVFVLVSTFVAVALAVAVDAAIDERPIAVRDSLDEARALLGPIIIWVLLAAGVWIGLQVLIDAVGTPILLTTALSVVWAVATIFVVPAIALECATAGEASWDSLRLARGRWGETLAGFVRVWIPLWLLWIPAGILFRLGIAQHDRNPEPGTGLPLVLAGLALGAAAFGIAMAVQAVFAVVLYRDGTGSLPGTEYVRRRPKSLVLRICGGIAVILFGLGILAALFHHDRRPSEDSHYWHFEYGLSRASMVAPGAPVLYRHRQVGAVVDSELKGGEVVVSFEVTPAAWGLVESRTMHIGGDPGHEFLAVGTKNGG